MACKKETRGEKEKRDKIQPKVEWTRELALSRGPKRQIGGEKVREKRWTRVIKERQEAGPLRENGQGLFSAENEDEK